MNIKHYFGHILGGIGGLITTISKSVYGKDMAKWFNDEGDKNLRINYNLDKHSIVFDLGGYEGSWTSDIYSKFCCKVYVFEPVKQFANKIKDRFGQNKDIFVFDFGLSDKSKSENIYLDNDRSSIYKPGKNIQTIRLVDVEEFLKMNSIDKIDLMKVNVEGGEYDLLEKMILNGLTSQVKYFQIQFHDYFSGARDRRRKIINDLSKTHELMWNYEFVWESWQLKENLN
jgi:FkbM family methyltransferase